MVPGRYMSSLRGWVVVGLGLMLVAVPGAKSAQDDEKKPVVILDTSMGKITLELDKEKAPISVENFLKYVDAGFYDNLIFHRVIESFMIQGGGFNAKMEEKSEGKRGKIKNESGNGLSNVRGTIAMARTPELDSAQSQFYINVQDNNSNPNLDRGRYAVFGKVIDGMDVVDKIKKVRTTTKTGADGHDYDDVPVEAVVIKSAKRKGKE
jgi:peptidyl-prolyl cis-trans isomerase A (cyclophilin A)